MKKKRSITEPREKPRPQRIRVPVMMLFRMFVLGSVAVVASAYAIWRYYHVGHVPMLRPVPSASSSADGFDFDVTAPR